MPCQQALRTKRPWQPTLGDPPIGSPDCGGALRETMSMRAGTPSPPHTFCDYSRTRTHEDEMSYGDKRSSIGFAITAAFVLAGSIPSNALPPQAITEDVKSCEAISNDQQRLKCYDSLFADKPDPTKPTEKSGNEDNRSIEESKSTADGSQQIVAANLVGDTVLSLRCKDQTTEAAFSTNYLGSRSVDVTLRINDEKPFKELWKASLDGRAAFASNAVPHCSLKPVALTEKRRKRISSG